MIIWKSFELIRLNPLSPRRTYLICFAKIKIEKLTPKKNSYEHCKQDLIGRRQDHIIYIYIYIYIGNLFEIN